MRETALTVAPRELYGVVGGMGPVASAEFLKTVYEWSPHEREQDAPAVVMYSDPSFPDRTDAFLAGSCEEVLACLESGLRALASLGATRVVLCCMTIHYLLPRLDPRLRRTVVSLLDLIFEEVAEARGRRLLLCSTGTRRLGLFEGHARWAALRGRFVLPDEDDQRFIHGEIIYPLKRRPDVAAAAALLDPLLEKYGVDSFVAGCSEIHMLAKHYAAKGAPACVDPLTTLARRWAAAGPLAPREEVHAGRLCEVSVS